MAGTFRKWPRFLQAQNQIVEACCAAKQFEQVIMTKHGPDNEENIKQSNTVGDKICPH
jgi:hypothetical protein